MKSGDEDALEVVLLRVEAQLKRYIHTSLGERMRRAVRHSDVLQNAYLELLRSLPTLEATTEAQFVAWVAKIIQNDIRRQVRWFSARKRKAPERTSEFNALAKILMGSTTTPSAQVSLQEEHARMQQAFIALPDEYRQVLQLAVFDSLPHKDVAQRMDRSEAATRMLLFRARAALGVALERT